MAATEIEWSDVVWNPVSGCTRVSAGCDHCYAVLQSHRNGMMAEKRGDAKTAAKYAGLTVLNAKGDRHFNGIVRTHEDALAVPFGWKKPRKVFVNSMSDMFHGEVPFEFIDRVFAVTALCPQHTFQILTKRPARMAKYLLIRSKGQDGADPIRESINRDFSGLGDHRGSLVMPPPNVWVGTSVENQDAADERIAHLLRCPSAVRFLSCEPLLGPLDLSSYLRCVKCGPRRRGWSIDVGISGPVCSSCNGYPERGVDWVIVGGESGPGARPCNIEWIRGIVHQCKGAGVPVFVKQLGLHPVSMPGCSNICVGYGRGMYCCDCGGNKHGTAFFTSLADRKGGDPSEWPEDLRVRELPKAAHA